MNKNESKRCMLCGHVLHNGHYCPNCEQLRYLTRKALEAQGIIVKTHNADYIRGIGGHIGYDMP